MTMPHFISDDGKAIVTTSYKVMYSTLCSAPRLAEIPIRRVRRYLASDIRPEHIFLCRNPYDRAISFYRDKLMRDLEDRGRKRRSFQWSQRFILRALGMGPFAPYKEKVATLKSLAFDDFLDLLPKVLWNGHLKPQTSQLKFNHWMALPDRIVNIENGQAAIEKYLGQDNWVNSTRAVKPQEAFEFPSRSLHIFNTLYRDDFLIGKYILREAEPVN